MYESWLTKRETARRLGLHENTVRNMTLDGRLASIVPPGLKTKRYDPLVIARMQRELAVMKQKALPLYRADLKALRIIVQLKRKAG